MKKPVHVATSLLVIALSGGPAAATDDVLDRAGSLVQPTVIEREWVARDLSTAVPNAITAPPGNCSGFTYGQPLIANEDPDIVAVPSESGSTFGQWAAEARLNESDVIAPMGAGAIDKLRWWGISERYNGSSFTSAYCNTDDAANTDFRYSFYGNDGGLPGPLLAVRTNSPTDRLTDQCWDCAEDNHFIAEYEATLFNQVDATSVAWVSIRRTQGGLVNGDECVFAWVSEDTAAHDEKFSVDAALAPENQDLTFCINKTTALGEYIDIFHGDFERGDFRYWSDTLE